MPETELNNNVVFVSQNLRNSASNPPAITKAKESNVSNLRSGRKKAGEDHSLLHNLNVDLFHVHFPIKLGRELGPLQQLGINSRYHFCKGRR